VSIWAFCIRRPVFTLVLTIGIIAFGLLGYMRMGVDQYPKIEPPVVTVVTILAGANPEVIDSDVTEVIEGEVGTLEGVDTISSTSSESRSTVTVTFSLNRDIDVAAQEVRDRVSSVRHLLPADIEPPLIEKIDPAAQPILWLAVSGDGPYAELSRLVDKDIKESIQALPGVGGIQVAGFRNKAVRVWLDATRLEAYQIAPNDVVRALQNWQVEIPGGRVENELTESTIKIEGEFESISELNTLIVATRNGASVRLGDVCSVMMGLDDERAVCRFRGKTTIGIGVRKQAGGNTVAVANQVFAAIPEMQSRLPDWVKIEIAFDSARFIKSSVSGATFDVLFGALITCVVIGLFLRSLQTTFISVLAIPTSLVGAFYVLYVLGYTINQMTLLGLSLAVGLVIDDAIVVIENIHRRLHAGEAPMVAALTGTGEVAFAVLSATTSIVVIFLPVAFMGGVVGQFFGSFGLTVAITIVISLVVSWTLTPMLASRFLTGQEGEGRLARWLGAPLDWIEQAYRFTLGAALANFFSRVLVLLAAAALFVLGMFLATRTGAEFVPSADNSSFMVIFETPLGSSLPAADVRVRRAEELVLAHKEVEGCFMATGMFTGQPNEGLFFITLPPPDKRAKTQRQLMDEMRKELADIPGFKAFLASVDPLQSGAIGAKSGAINYVLQGPDLKRLEQLAQALTDKMKADPIFVDVDFDLKLTRPEVKVELDRDAAADLGVDNREISLAIQAFMGGIDVARFTERGERYDITVKGLPEQRTRAVDLQRVAIKNRDGQLFPLAAVTDLVEGYGPNQVNRYNRQRAVSITANLAPGIVGGEGDARFLKFSKEVLAGQSQYKIVAAGQSKLMAESMNYLAIALLMSVITVYLVLSAQFESFIHPFTVMLSLPLATVGVFGALVLTGKTLNVYSFIGIIMLVGIVTRNAILLIDRMHHNQEHGMSPLAAALEAGPVRLRPILMTSIAAVVGLIPVAIGNSEGGEARAPMGIAVIGGLLASTFLTLYVIPVVYLFLERLTGRKVGR